MTKPRIAAPVAGFRHVFLQMRTMLQSEIFLIIIEEDRKQFAVEGPLIDVQPWNRAVAAAQEVGCNVRGFDIAAASRIALRLGVAAALWPFVPFG